MPLCGTPALIFDMSEKSTKFDLKIAIGEIEFNYQEIRWEERNVLVCKVVPRAIPYQMLEKYLVTRMNKMFLIIVGIEEWPVRKPNWVFSRILFE